MECIAIFHFDQRQGAHVLYPMNGNTLRKDHHGAGNSLLVKFRGTKFEEGCYDPRLPLSQRKDGQESTHPTRHNGPGGAGGNGEGPTASLCGGGTDRVGL